MPVSPKAKAVQVRPVNATPPPQGPAAPPVPEPVINVAPVQPPNVPVVNVPRQPAPNVQVRPVAPPLSIAVLEPRVLTEQGAQRGAERVAGSTPLIELVRRAQSGDVSVMLSGGMSDQAALLSTVTGKLGRFKLYLDSLAARGDRYAAEVLNSVERLFTSRYGQVDRWGVSVPLSDGQRPERLGFVLDRMGKPQVDAQMLDFGG